MKFWLIYDNLFKNYEISLLLIRLCICSHSMTLAVLFWNHLVELFKGEFLIRLRLSRNKHAVHQLQNIIIRQILPNKLYDLLKLLKPNLPSLLSVIQVKHSFDPIPCPAVPSLLTYHIYELLKVQNLILLSQCPHNVQNVRVAVGQAKVLQHLDNLLGIDWATSVLVKD